MLQHVVVRDLLDNPGGDPLSIAQAACAIGKSDARVSELVRLGVLRGQLESDRVINVSRASVARLYERTRDRAIRP